MRYRVFVNLYTALRKYKFFLFFLKFCKVESNATSVVLLSNTTKYRKLWKARLPTHSRLIHTDPSAYYLNDKYRLPFLECATSV